MDVTLDLELLASQSQEWPMTYIAVRCLHCQSEQIVKRGKTAQGPQRYLLTGCEFSGEQCLRSCALVEVQRERRVWCRQKKAWYPVAARTTKCP
jgi:hypothetical protein